MKKRRPEGGSRRRPSARQRAWLLALTMFTSAIGGWHWLTKDPYENTDLAYVDGHLLNAKLLDLPANTWVRVVEDDPGWTRQSHAGLAFDSKRGTLLVFGSDTHGENWDNSVHEFNPLTLSWVTHYRPSPAATYGADSGGAAIAGPHGEFPWAMHSYDSVVYAPSLDALVVTATKDHTPAPTADAQRAIINPTWVYHLDSKEWEAVYDTNGNVPTFFAAASAYEPDNGAIAAYRKSQLWFFDPLSRAWHLAPGNHNTDLEIHFTMVTDTQRHRLAIFGNSTQSTGVWLYNMSAMPNLEGHWEKKLPGGDACPADQHFPVAYDARQGVFLLLPDRGAEASITLVYEPDSNRYIRVPGADMPALGMNYMMEFDTHHQVFWLVTGDWKSTVSVWAFRLDLAALLTA